MKRWISVIFLLVIFAAAGFYIYQKSQEIKISSLEGIMPEDVVYYLYSYNAAGKIKEFQASPFSQEVSASSFYLNFIQPLFKQMRAKLPFLTELMEKDTALAVYSLGNNLSPAGIYSGQLADFLLAVRIDPQKGVAIKKTLAGFYSSLTGKDQISRDTYHGIKITNYRLPKKNMSIHYASISDVILMSNSIGIIRQAIDLAKNKNTASLRNNANFKQAMARIEKDALLWGYMSNKNYYKQTLPAYLYQGDKSAAYVDRMKPLLDLVNILEDTVFYVGYDQLKSGLTIKSYQRFAKSLNDEKNILKFFYSRQMLDKTTFNLVPRSIIAYYGGNQNLGNIWKAFKDFNTLIQGMAKAQRQNQADYRMRANPLAMPNPEELFNKLESTLGVSIAGDILPCLGNNFGLVFADLEGVDIAVQTASATPMPQTQPIILPRLYAFMELKDSSKMQEVMQRIIQNIINNINNSMNAKKATYQFKGEPVAEGKALPEPPQEYLKLQSEIYRDIDISRIEFYNNPVPSLSFNYCILDNKYIIISLSLDLTKKVIDVYKDRGNSLSANFEFGSAQDKVSANYFSIAFFDLKRLIGNLKETKFFNQLKSNLSLDNPLGFSQKNLDSLLSILSQISSFTFTSEVIDDYTVDSSGYIKIKGL